METQKALFEYCLNLGDSSLVLGHRLSEWCGHGPILEEDIALINISLDLIGQATNILSYAGEVEGKGRSHDDLAYKRDAKQYRNLLICEQPNGHYGTTIARQFLFDTYHYYLLQQLINSDDPTIKAYAEKTLKEVTYHLKHSTDWMLRLGDGTEESHQKVQEALDQMWKFTGELFQPSEADIAMLKEGIGADLSLVKQQWEKSVKATLEEATLKMPENNWAQIGGKEGKHTEQLGYILAEMQFLPRAYPDATW